MAKDKIFYLMGTLLLIGLGIILLNYSGLFVISENDLITNGIKSEVIINQNDSYDLLSNFSINGNNISFIVGGQVKNYNSPKVFFMMDNSTTIYDTFQDITEGTHTIKEYQIYIDFDKIHLKKWEKTYDVLVKTVYVNRTVANQTFYVNNTVYVNQTVPEYINNTVEKQVQIEPSVNYIVNKYKIYLIAIIAVGLVYYLTRKKK